MKKWLLCLLAVMMLLTSCTGGSTDTSSTSEETSAPDTSSDKNYTLVSVGKPYTISGGPNERYPDTFSQQITDGQIAPNIGTHYIDTRMVGFDNQATFQIDLGEDGKRVSAIAVRSLDMSTDGVGLANTARFMVSKDGEDFEILGIKTFELTGEKTVSTLYFDFEENGKTIDDYRYIRVVVNGRAGYHFFFLDEIMVYADVEEKATTDFAELAYKNESIDRDAWKDVSTGNVATPVDTVNIADGLKYTFKNATFDERAPENATHLTDSMRTSRLFGEDAWIGFNGNGDAAPCIDFELGKRYANLYSFKVHALGAGLDVRYPEYIDVYSSVNGQEYSFLGRMYAPADCDNYAYQLVMLEYISARYIRFEFPKTEDGYYWIEEVQIYTGFNEEQQKNVYPDLNFPTVTEDVYFDSADADYTTVQNLLVGADQQMAAMYYDGLEENPWAESHPEYAAYDFAGLHDGLFAKSTDCYSGEYFYTRGTCTDIFYDMGAIGSIQKLSVSVLENAGAAIYRPKYITVFLSNDGDNWYKVGYHERARGFQNEVDASKTSTHLTFDFELDKAYSARFVRFRIERDTHSPTFIFMDELSAYGTKEVTADTAKLSDLGVEPVIYYTNPERAEYVTLDNSTMNAKDLVLFVGNKGDEDMLLPFVAYLDENGEIKDTFMDGFIYWGPAVLPSGGKMYAESVKRDWEHMMEITFNGINGLDRLEEVVGEVKEALNMPDYTAKVYISLLTIIDTIEDFGGPMYDATAEDHIARDEEGNILYYDGDCDGDGINETLATTEGRKTVINWYINSVMTEFEARGYENIVIDGFNWCNEDVLYSADGARDDSHIMTEVGECVEAAGSNFIWIPYYFANRYYLGNEMNFDAVCMQPNYVFTNDAPIWRFDASAEATKNLGMSIEIEHSYQCLGDPVYARSYMLYLLYGAEYGYMDGIHMYYQDQDNYAKMGYSDDPLCRLQYDATYHFIKGDLDVAPDSRDAITVSGSKDTILKGTLNEDDALELYTIVKYPEHGILSLTTDGDYVYYPDKGYTGSDSFSYTYNEFLGESEECVVNINIG